MELGAGAAGFASGDFYADPDPAVVLRRPGRTWHAGKVPIPVSILHACRGGALLGDAIGQPDAHVRRAREHEGRWTSTTTFCVRSVSSPGEP